MRKSLVWLSPVVLGFVVVFVLSVYGVWAQTSSRGAASAAVSVHFPPAAVAATEIEQQETTSNRTPPGVGGALLEHLAARARRQHPRRHLGGRRVGDPLLPRATASSPSGASARPSCYGPTGPSPSARSRRPWCSSFSRPRAPRPGPPRWPPRRTCRRRRAGPWRWSGSGRRSR